MIEHKIRRFKEKIMNQRRMRIGSALLTGLALLVFGACEQPSNSDTNPPPASASIGNVTIEGVINYSLNAPQDAVISISGQSLREAIGAGTDLAGWIQNLPDGLTAVAKDAAPAGSTTITITIDGKPTEVFDEALAITIPIGVLTDYKPLAVNSNANAKFAIIEADATVGDVTIVGIVESASITNPNLTITLYADSLKNQMNAGDELNGWITNLPASLTAKARYPVLAGGKVIDIVISGTPDAVSPGTALIINIPGS
jgi:hypothetical protein